MAEGVQTIVGREAELDAIQRLLGRGELVALEGEPGIGKTTVWKASIERARSAGWRVLEARPAEAEATLSYAGLADLVGDVYDELGDVLPAPQRRALGAALLRAESEQAEDPRTIGTAVLSLLGLLAGRGNALVAVDDVQWLDRPSARALAFALRRLPHGVAVLVARRTGPDAPEPALALDRLERLELGPLSLAALQHVLRNVLGLVPTRPMLGRITEASGGNPFYALELARASTDELSVPPTLSELVASRLRRLPPETNAALLRAAATTRPTAVDAKALEPAEHAGVVAIRGDRVEFAHPLYRAAIYASASTAERRALHARLARDVADEEERARHLSLAAPEPDAEVAHAIEAGAERARGRGALDGAAELLEAAARVTPDETTRRRRILGAAEYHFHAGEHRRAEALVDDVLAGLERSALRGEAFRLLGQIRCESNFPAAVEVFERALAEPLAAETAVRVRLDLAFALTPIGELERARRYADEAVDAARALGEGPLLGDALAVQAIAGFVAGEPWDRELLAYAVSLEDRERPQRLLMRPSSIAAQLAMHESRIAEAREQLREIRAWALERGQDGELPFMLIHLAAVEWRRGAYAEALEVADEAITVGEQSGSETMNSVALIHRAIAHVFLGEVDAARTDLAECRRLLRRGGWAYAERWAAGVEGFLELSLGDADRAVAALEPLIASAESSGIPHPWHGVFAPDAVEALVLTGDVERAARVAEAFEASASRDELTWARGEAARSRALVEASSGDLDAALASAQLAYDLVPAEMPFHSARCLLVVGEVHRRRREKRLAADSLRRAAEAFDELVAPLWAARARAELERVGLRRRDPDELTESERRIAELAASGLTNREVAQAAFVSPKTVEANLGRVYAKLGISSRAELGARMAQRDTTPQT